MAIDILKNIDFSKGRILIILCGPPCSGKSSFANKMVENYEHCMIISPDQIREELTGDKYDQSQNIIVFSKVYSRLSHYLDAGYNVIYDATNCRSAYRHKVINFCKENANMMICFVSTTSISECLKQNASQEKPMSDDVIEKMYFNLRKYPPSIFEGYDIIARF